MQKHHEEELTMMCLRHSEINIYQLCYVDINTAYFSSCFATQWGDDWDDAPYEHNAGTPYEHDNGKIYKIMFDGVFERPEENHYNSPYSVQDINAKKVPWLQHNDYFRLTKDNALTVSPLWAGVTAKEFIIFVLKHDGDIYIRM